MQIIVLGTAAGGGLPQWNCNCPVCRLAWMRTDLRATQTSLAVSADGEHWFLVNASPDIRQQIIDTPQLHPKTDRLRHSPIAGVILTNGEVDAIAGLLSLREGSPYTIWGHDRVLRTLEENSIFNVLDRGLVPRRRIVPDEPFRPLLPDGQPSGLEIEAFEVAGKPAWYLEGVAGAGDEAGSTLGLHIRTAEEDGFYVITACDAVTDGLAERISGARLVLFDGTLWRDDEIVEAGLGRKTGRRMGHISMSGEDGAIEGLAGLGIGRRMFIHINNSNRVHLPGSSERRALETAGWEIPAAGQVVTP